MKSCKECWKLDDEQASYLEEITCPKSGKVRREWDYCEFEHSDTMESLLNNGKTVLIIEEIPCRPFTRTRVTAQYKLGEEIHSSTIVCSDREIEPEIASEIIKDLLIQKKLRR